MPKLDKSKCKYHQLLNGLGKKKSTWCGCGERKSETCTTEDECKFYGVMPKGEK